MLTELEYEGYAQLQFLKDSIDEIIQNSIPVVSDQSMYDFILTDVYTKTPTPVIQQKQSTSPPMYSLASPLSMSADGDTWFLEYEKLLSGYEELGRKLSELAELKSHVSQSRVVHQIQDTYHPLILTVGCT